MCYPGGPTPVCLLAAVLCGSPATVCPYPMYIAVGLSLWNLWSGENQRKRTDACKCVCG